MPSAQQEARAAERRQHVAHLYIQGAYQADIARQLGVTQQQISKDLRTLQAQWRGSALRDFDEAKGLELQRIDAIEREAWQAWERSKQPREVTLTEQSEGEKVSRKASVRREGQAGDPRFLERIQKCIEQRCDILGLNAPKRYKFDWDTLSDQQLERLAAGDDPGAVMAEA